eukprot:GHRQ01028995.1.p1 GENE.GHRQ01028995.1~~GHRQ01028995.1.p1  ORF type:complete len:137 (+),score=4.77 GHRQ01028995.1:323-733(+)
MKGLQRSVASTSCQLRLRHVHEAEPSRAAQLLLSFYCFQRCWYLMLDDWSGCLKQPNCLLSRCALQPKPAATAGWSAAHLGRAAAKDGLALYHCSCGNQGGVRGTASCLVAEVVVHSRALVIQLNATFQRKAADGI